MVELGDLPGGRFKSLAFATTPDGGVIVGCSESAAGLEAFRWTAEGGMVALGDLPGGAFRSMALAVSADGNTILCAATTAAGEEYAVWTPGEGMRNLRERLIGLGVAEVRDWSLSGHHGGISADGGVLAGYGKNPSGNQEAWIARIAPGS
jgi:hypothetical protein